MNDKELEDLGELILHDELNNLDTMMQNLMEDSEDDWVSYLLLEQRVWLQKLVNRKLISGHVLRKVQKILMNNYYTDDERLFLNDIRRKFTK